MKFSQDKKKKLTWWIIEIATICILIFFVSQNTNVISDAISSIIEIISPLLSGLIIALILNVPMKFFESHLWMNTKNKALQKVRKPISFIISLVLIIGILTLIICLVIPELIGAAKVIVQGTYNLIDKLQSMDKVEIVGVQLDKILNSADWDKMLSNVQNWIKDKSGSIVTTAFSTAVSVIGGVMNFFIALVFSIYILFGKDKLKSQAARLIKAWTPEKASENIIHISFVANKNFGNFISGQSLEAVILGILCMIGMIILRIPYAPMVGALVGITALIPVVGGFIGAAVGAFMILTVSPFKALVFVIFLIILQQIEGNVIYPKVMGSKVNLPAIWILAAVTVGGSIGGVLGMFLSVPITSTLYQLLKEETLKKEAQKATFLDYGIVDMEDKAENENANKEKENAPENKSEN